ncbi:MAG: penicillin-binding protein activator LpoB [Planctomycetes bacterium]|nr:penicillin-binding protein activator LpoB [Planctomycetota bacterium]
MFNRSRLIMILAAPLAFATACAGSTRRIDASSNEGLVTAHDVNFKDWQDAAESLTNSLLQSSVLANYTAQNPTVMQISNVVNKTTQHLDTEILTDKIRIALLGSGKVFTTTAIGKRAEDDATKDARALGNDPMIDPNTVQPNRTVQAPRYSLSGIIIQIKVKEGGASESYFNFKLTLTDLKTGLGVWENEKEIAKQTTRSGAGW